MRKWQVLAKQVTYAFIVSSHDLIANWHVLFIYAIGLIYLILKYYVDKNNIYNVHHPTSLRGRQTLHRNAVNFVMIGAFILQVTILCYLVLRKGICLCNKLVTEVVI